MTTTAEFLPTINTVSHPNGLSVDVMRLHHASASLHELFIFFPNDNSEKTILFTTLDNRDII